MRDESVIHVIGSREAFFADESEGSSSERSQCRVVCENLNLIANFGILYEVGRQGRSKEAWKSSSFSQKT
jgi:hypothetical protein